MTEELYIIKDGKRHLLDLNTPSGITLSFESNLFTSLESVNCNRSYTFSIPRTINNERIMEMMNDIRVESKIGRKMQCELRIDGLPIVSNGNIYVTQYDGSYSAVMTWDVIEGLQKIKDDDISINELDAREDVEAGMVLPILNYANAKQDDFDNFKSVLTPWYGAGVSVYPPRTGNNRREMMYMPWYYPLPVVPVPYLLRRIENHYGISMPIYRRLTSDNYENDIINYGVIPFASTKVAEAHYHDNYCALFNLSKTYNGVASHNTECPFAFWFETAQIRGTGNLFNSYYSFVEREEQGLLVRDINHNIQFTGTVYAEFNTFSLKENEDADSNEKYEAPTLHFCTYIHSRNADEFTKSLVSVKGVKIKEERIPNSDYEYITYEYNIDPYIAGEDAKMKGQHNRIFLAFSNDPFRILNDEQYSTNLLVRQVFEEGDYPHDNTDIISNLPEVTCMDFVKSLFYMNCAFPMMKDGGIVMQKYSDIIANTSKAYNWTRRVVNIDDVKITSKVGDFGKRNWFLAKNDSIPTEEDKEETEIIEKSDDEYADGFLCIETSYEDADDDKTIVQVPWNAPYIVNGDNPRLETGDTLKYWTHKYGEDEISAKEAAPCYGIIQFVNPVNGFKGNYTREQAGKLLHSLFPNANCDNTAFLRKIPASKARGKGWDVSGDFCTHISTSYELTDGRGGKSEFLFTPIDDFGNILSPQELRDYAKNIEILARIKANHGIAMTDRRRKKLLIGKYPSVAIADYYASVLHQLAEIYYGEAGYGSVTADAPEGLRRGTSYDKPYLSMKAWEGFSTNEEFKTLAALIDNPTVITIKLDLSIFDLADLDFSIPAYLEQYNSYFCIIKIQRETDGISTAELLKIPTELLK